MEMKKTFRLAAIAALMAGFTACSNEDMTSPAQPENQVRLTATIASKSSDVTRSLASDGKTTAWEVGEEIAVYYENTAGDKRTGKAAVTSVDGSGKATVEATLTSPVSGKINLVYPYSLSNGTGGIDKSQLLTQQVGTIDGDNGISKRFDAAIAEDVDMTVSGTEATFAASLTNPLCICKFTFKNDEAADLTSQFSILKINDGVNYYTVQPSTGLSAVYVAMLPAENARFTFAVSGGSLESKYAKTFKATLAAGKSYTSPLTLTAVPAGAWTLGELTSSEIGYVIASNGYAYAYSSVIPYGESATAIVAYVGDAGSVETGMVYKGIAIATTDLAAEKQWAYGYITSDLPVCLSPTTSVATARERLDGIAMTSTLIADGHTHATASGVGTYTPSAPSNTSGWFLPSLGQWQLVLMAVTGSAYPLDTSFANSDYTYSKFNSALYRGISIGIQEGRYWTSTEYSNQYAWVMDFADGTAVRVVKNGTNYVRPFFAF